MKSDLPPRGSEEARQVLSTMYAVLTHHVNPLECLGFETGPGVPLPTLEQIENHVENARALLFELCESREQYNEYDSILQQVHNRALVAISETLGQPVYTSASTFLRGLLVKEGLVSSLVVVALGFLIALCSEAISRRLLVPNSPWLPIVSVAIYATALCMLFRWLCDYVRNRLHSNLIAVASAFPYAMFTFAKQEELLRGFEREVVPQAMNSGLPLISALGMLGGVLVSRRMSRDTQVAAHSVADVLYNQSSLNSLIEGNERLSSRKFKTRTHRFLRMVATPIPAALTMATCIGLLEVANRRAPLLPPTKGELEAMNQVVSLRDELKDASSLLASKETQSANDAAESRRELDALKLEIKEKSSRISELEDGIAVAKDQLTQAKKTATAARTLVDIDSTSLALVLQEAEWTSRSDKNEVTLRFGPSGGVMLVNHKTKSPAMGTWTELAEDKVVVEFFDGREQKQLEIRKESGKVIGYPSYGNGPEELLPVPPRMRLSGGVNSGF